MEAVQQYQSRRGVLYGVAEATGVSKRGIQDIPQDEMSHLFFMNPAAAVYFKEAQHMFYYPQGSLDICTPDCSSGSVKYTLRDHCADFNLVTQELAERKGWRIIPTGTALSTGTEVDSKVLGTVDTLGAFLHLLPGTEHEVRLRLEETLVVGNTDLFEVLIGNQQMKPVADSNSNCTPMSWKHLTTSSPCP